EGPIRFERTAKRGSELLAIRIRLHANQAVILKCQREWIAGIQALMAEEAKNRSPQEVGSALGDDVDHTSSRRAVFGGVVSTVDLELLDDLLADRRPHAAASVIGFSAIHTDAVSPPVTAVEGEAAIGRLLHAKTGPVRQGLRVRHPWSQQDERE